MERFFYHIHSEDVLPKLESGKSVTYAAYCWACKNLRDVLDGNAHEELKRQRTRTGDLPVAKARKEVWTDLSTRIQMHRKRDKALKLERRLVEIRKYVDDTKLESIVTTVEKRYKGQHQRKEQKGGFSSKSV